MNRLDASRYQVTVRAREGGKLFHYKYTLGDWKAGEKAAGTAPCPDVANRELTVDFGEGGKQSVNDRVAAWASVPPC